MFALFFFVLIYMPFILKSLNLTIYLDVYLYVVINVPLVSKKQMFMVVKLIPFLEPFYYGHLKFNIYLVPLSEVLFCNIHFIVSIFALQKNLGRTQTHFDKFPNHGYPLTVAFQGDVFWVGINDVVQTSLCIIPSQSNILDFWKECCMS